MEFGNKGIQMTFKFDKEQLQAMTEVVLGFLKKAKSDVDEDLEDMNERIKQLSDKIERLSK